MSPDQYSELLTTVGHMRDTSDALSRTCAMLAAGETDAARHGYFHRLHVSLNDCKLALHHALDAAPVMVRQEDEASHVLRGRSHHQTRRSW
jgi:hypothetical protein